MRTLAWSTGAVAGQLRDRIWTYLSPSSDPTTLALEAAALLQMDDGEILTLARLHFLLSNEVGRFLESILNLLRRLPTTTAHEEEWSTERVRGAVQWHRTFGARAATGLPHLYVTQPPERAYQTPENELLVFLLDAIELLSFRSGWTTFAGVGAGTTIGQRAAEATRWLQNRTLAGVLRRAPTARTIARIRSGRHRRRYQPSLDTYALYQSLIAELERTTLRRIIESEGLITRQESTLFELLCTFRILDELRALGWTIPTFKLFDGNLHLVGFRDAQRIDVWYQTTPRDLRRSSEYVATLAAHGFGSPQDLRPDLVLRIRQPNPRWLLVECKLRRKGVEHAARAALSDLLAYRRAFRAAISTSRSPIGLGLAWGAELTAAPGEAILLATPDRLASALAAFAG